MRKAECRGRLTAISSDRPYKNLTVQIARVPQTRPVARGAHANRHFARCTSPYVTRTRRYSPSITCGASPRSMCRNSSLCRAWSRHIDCATGPSGARLSQVPQRRRLRRRAASSIDGDPENEDERAIEILHATQNLGKRNRRREYRARAGCVRTERSGRCQAHRHHGFPYGRRRRAATCPGHGAGSRPGVMCRYPHPFSNAARGPIGGRA